MKPLRWAQGQGPGGRGTNYHVVVADVYEGAQGIGSPVQRTACGTTIVQSEEWHDGASRDYLRSHCCSRCLAKFPVPAEDTTITGDYWAGWMRSGTPSPIFGEPAAVVQKL